MSPSYQHSYVQSKLIVALSRYEQFSVFSELTLVIGDQEYVPDICLYPKQTVTFGEEDQVRMTEMPLLAVEILSPSQTLQDGVEKLKAYFSAGVKSCWLVSPFTMTINVYNAMKHVQIFHTGEVIDSAMDIRIPLNAIFV
jgi:Uma2 family endonuclease